MQRVGGETNHGTDGAKRSDGDYRHQTSRGTIASRRVIGWPTCLRSTCSIEVRVISRPLPSVELGYEAVEAATGGVEKRREYWRWALMAMLGLLATEWWVYTKRVA